MNASLKCVSLSYGSTSVGQWINSDCNASSQLHFLCLSGQYQKIRVNFKRKVNLVHVSLRSWTAN